MLARVRSSISDLPFFSAGLPTLYQAFPSRFVNLLSLSSPPIIPLLYRVISAVDWNRKVSTLHSIPWVVIYCFACLSIFHGCQPNGLWNLYWFDLYPDSLHWHVVLKQEFQVFLYPFISFHSHDSLLTWTVNLSAAKLRIPFPLLGFHQNRALCEALTRSARLILT